MKNTILILYLMAVLLCVSSVFLVWVNREHKRRERRCKQCGHKEVERIPKLYPQGFRNPASEKESLWQRRLLKGNGILCRFYMFKRCLHCGRFTLERSDDKVFPRWELEWKRVREPNCFKHETELFRMAGISSPIPELSSASRAMPLTQKQTRSSVPL